MKNPWLDKKNNSKKLGSFGKSVQNGQIIYPEKIYLQNMVKRRGKVKNNWLDKKEQPKGFEKVWDYFSLNEKKNLIARYGKKFKELNKKVIK